MKPLLVPADIDPARFWRRVDTGPVAACWPWSGGRRKGGYGRFSYQREGRVLQLGAHRVALVLAGGELTEGAFVCHTCDNPPCCNPAHLFVGTQLDNMRDAGSKNRLPVRGHALNNLHKTKCKSGHEYDEQNTGINKNGSRYCRRCHASRELQRYHARGAKS